MFIDSHCHVLKSEFTNPEEIIELAIKDGVRKLIINGYDLASSIEAVSLANKYKGVYASVGIGPENISDYSEQEFKNFELLIKSDKVVAIGEIGLDYYWTKENKNEQITVFERFLKLASDNDLPVIVHSRDSIEDTYKLLKKYNVKGIMHCFSGSYEMAKKFIEIGFLIGVGGIVTFKNAKKIKDVVSKIDIDCISLETDSPYLSPEPYRGKINKPSNIPIIAENIAKIKNISTENVAKVTTNNIYKVFVKMLDSNPKN